MSSSEALRRQGLSMPQALIEGWLEFQAPVLIAENCAFRHVSLGAYTYVQEQCRLAEATIGNYCSIADGVRVGLYDHASGAASTHPFSVVNFFRFHAPGHKPAPWFNPASAKVTIEDDVWIGADAIIIGQRPTVIGRGAVIGAGAVVTKDVAPYTIVGGNPARVIRSRFPPETVEALTATRWWEFDLPRYGEANPADHPPMSSPEALLEWWNAGGKTRVEAFRLSGERRRVRTVDGQTVIETPPSKPRHAPPSKAAEPPPRAEVKDWATDFDHLDSRWAETPNEVWRELRETCPVAHTRRYGGVYLPTRYADVRAVAYDAEGFSSRKVWILSRQMTASYPAPPITSDPPAHRLHRQLLVPAFSAQAAARYRPAIAQACKQLLAEIAANPLADAARDYTQPAAMRLTYMLFGVEPRHEKRFGELANAVAPVGDPHPDLLVAAGTELDEYFKAQVWRRISEPGDDLVSLLTSIRVNGKPLPIVHICVTLRAVLAAAVETSSATASFALQHLARHPEDRARLAADPALMDSAVEEFLRLSAPATSTRYVVKDAEVGGCPVKAGELVILPFGAANRDPEVFPDPERAILDRADNRHLAFGAGIHRCIGFHLAQMLIKTSLGAWLEAFPDFELDPSRPVERFSGMMHGPKRVPVILPPIKPPAEGGETPPPPRARPRPRPRVQGLPLNIGGVNATVFTRVWNPASAPRGSIIYLHGYPDNSTDGDDLGAAAAAAGYQVICPDWPGRGRSSWLPQSHYSVPNFINLIPEFMKLATAEVSFFAACWSSFPVAHYLASTKSTAKVIFNDPPMRGGPGYDRIAKMLIEDGPKTFRDMSDYAAWLRKSRGSTYLLNEADLEDYARKRAIWLDGRLRGGYDPALTGGIDTEIGRESGIYTVLPFIKGDTMVMYAENSDFWDDALVAQLARDFPRIKVVTDLAGGHPSLLNDNYQTGLVLDFLGR